jgi:hypothetical protein
MVVLDSKYFLIFLKFDGKQIQLIITDHPHTKNTHNLKIVVIEVF